MHQHRPALARQQQCQQGREHWQLARTVVAGQHDQRALGGGEQGAARQRGIEKAQHFIHAFAFDAHGHAKGAHLQIAHLAIEQLPEQVGRLLTRQRACAAHAATNFLDVLTDSHGL